MAFLIQIINFNNFVYANSLGNDYTAQIEEFTRFHQSLLSNISTTDINNPFKKFDDSFDYMLNEATQKIYGYSKNKQLCAEPEKALHESIDDIKGLFHIVIKNM